MGGLLALRSEQSRCKLHWQGLSLCLGGPWLLLSSTATWGTRGMKLWGPVKGIRFIFLFYLSIGSNASLWAKLEKCQVLCCWQMIRGLQNLPILCKGHQYGFCVLSKNPKDSGHWNECLGARDTFWELVIADRSCSHAFTLWHHLNVVFPSVFSLLCFSFLYLSGFYSQWIPQYDFFPLRDR